MWVWDVEITAFLQLYSEVRIRRETRLSMISESEASPMQIHYTFITKMYYFFSFIFWFQNFIPGWFVDFSSFNLKFSWILTLNIFSDEKNDDVDICDMQWSG